MRRKRGDTMLDKFALLKVMSDKKMTQTRLAKEIKVSKNTLNAKINGKGFFDTKEIDDICNILNITDGNLKANIFLSQSSQ